MADKSPKVVKNEIKLREPVQQGSELISVLKITSPKAKHIRSLPAEPSTGDVLDLAGKLCGQPPSVIDELGMDDTMELLEIVGELMDRGQKTGRKR